MSSTEPKAVPAQQQEFPIPGFSLFSIMGHEFHVVNPQSYVEIVGNTFPDFTTIPLSYSFGVNRIIRLEEEAVVYRIRIEIFMSPNSSEDEINKATADKIKIAHVECSFAFSVSNLSQQIIESDSKRTLPEALNLSMVGVAYSTLRGITWQKFSGTHLTDLLLPVVHPAAVLGLRP